MTNKTILVVDDDSLMLKLIEYTLSSRGFKVIQASNGQEALETLEKHKKPVDLIITDFSMPILNGLELANSVRGHKKYHNTPLILITANSEITNSPDPRYNVFNHIIPKPFTSEVILEKVSDLIG